MQGAVFNICLYDKSYEVSTATLINVSKRLLSSYCPKAKGRDCQYECGNPRVFERMLLVSGQAVALSTCCCMEVQQCTGMAADVASRHDIVSRDYCRLGSLNQVRMDALMS